MANIVAIVGRPNVGKSTLFNRLVEQRKAITDDVAGVTRDRHYGMGEWNGVPFTVIDTGGYVTGSDDQFEREIRKQVEIALEEASVIVLMVDCVDGLTDLDKEFANFLRGRNKPIIIAANKADNQERMFGANEFYALGFEQIFPVAAISGSGTGELLDDVVTYLDQEVVSDNELPRITILGRPNVGKSSFLNVLLGEERSIVTDIAGTTRDSIDTHYHKFGKDFLLVDTAGIRKKTKVRESIEFYSVMRSIQALQNSDVCIIMIDVRDGLESQDMNIISLAHRYRKGIVIMVNKWDLVAKDTKTLDSLQTEIVNKLGPLAYIPIVFTSVVNKQRIFKVVEKALEVYSGLGTKITTSRLNDTLLPEIAATPPPSVKGKYIKIKYITQLASKSPSFAFFCNFPQYVKDPYKRFLEKRIRHHFGFEGIPLNIFLRKK